MNQKMLSLRFRRAASLIATFEKGGIVLQNYLTHERFGCSAECLEFLAGMDDWIPAGTLFELMPWADRISIAEQVPDLVAAGVIVVTDTPQAERDDQYRREWQWGESAGFFHFSIRDTRFVTGKSASTFIQKRKLWRPSPSLYASNIGKKIFEMPAVDIKQEPLALMYKRRSNRSFDGNAISMQSLSDCLFAGNGIIELRNAGDFGQLPITMTPSGGARNPFELYVYANKVKDLGRGFYHYDALQHNLGLIAHTKADISGMLGTQRWPIKASAIIFLAANFARSMWKYHMPMAYRVVIMEAGFIGQNIALVATRHGLSAVPSGAIRDSKVERYLRLPAVASGVLLSMSIGKPKC